MMETNPKRACGRCLFVGVKVKGCSGKVKMCLPEEWCDVSNVLKEWSYFR